MKTTRSWEGFLPKKAVVMARKKSTSTKKPEAIQALDTTPVSAQVPAAKKAKTSKNDPETLLQEVGKDLEGCPRCKLCKGRTNIVLGEGNPSAKIVFVGEAPGEQEDLSGRPFVGRAGQLLEKMIEAMGIKRSDIFICNVVKCRPPDNRNPEPDEIEACSPYLFRQLDAIQPKVVIALGKFAAQTLLKTETPISQIRGKFFPYRGAKLIPTFHPAYLLRNPPAKKEVWEDLQLVMKELGMKPAKK